MDRPLALIFDIGTQSTRGLLFDKQGNLVHKTQVSEDFFVLGEDGRAEKDTLSLYDGVVKVCRLIRNEAPQLLEDVVAVSVTSIRNTTVFLDAEGNPTRNTILWLDKREVDCPDPLPAFNRFLYFLVGMSESVRVFRKTSYTNWVRVNQPDIWAKTAKVVVPSTYVNFRLTGNLTESNAGVACKIPFDYKKRCWQTKRGLTYPVFGTPIDKMCDLVNPGEILGYITERCSKETGLRQGLPVVASGTDKGCESLGVGAVTSNVASISLGTASSVEICTDKYVEPEAFMPAYPSVVMGKWNPEIQIFRGFWMVSWFREQFALYEQKEAEETGEKVERILDRKLSNVPVGSHGLILQPLWGPGLKNPEAKGSMIGFTDVHDREYMYRAIIEGLCYGLLDGLNNMQTRAKIQVDRVGVSGGGSQSDVICQILSDVVGKPVYRVQTHETSGLGAAMVSFVGVNQFKDLDEALKSMRHVKDEFVPNAADHKIYHEYYNRVYRRMYRYMRPLYDELYDILGEKCK